MCPLTGEAVSPAQGLSDQRGSADPQPAWDLPSWAETQNVLGPDGT